MKCAPVILFVYNRPLHTEQTIKALQKNIYADKSDLFIFSDGAKGEAAVEQVMTVREILANVEGFKSITIVERSSNWGLAKSVIAGVTSVISDFGKAIVLEDDLVTSPYFLKYMNEALEFYKDEHKVFSISGYNHPPNLMKFPKDYPHDVYFNYRNSSWGWATWKDRWYKSDWEIKDFEAFVHNKQAQKDFNRGGEDMADMLKDQMQGKLDSWAIRWSYSHFIHDAVSVCPVRSYVNNIGMDASGTHCGKTNKFENDLSKAKSLCDFFLPVRVNEAIMHSFRRVYKRSFKSKIKHKIKQILKMN